MKLTTQDFQSATWQKIAALCEQRLDVLRKQNDGPLDAIETANKRGRIAEVKRILAMANPSPTKPADDD